MSCHLTLSVFKRRGKLISQKNAMAKKVSKAIFRQAVLISSSSYPCLSLAFENALKSTVHNKIISYRVTINEFFLSIFERLAMS